MSIEGKQHWLQKRLAMSFGQLESNSPTTFISHDHLVEIDTLAVRGYDEFCRSEALRVELSKKAVNEVIHALKFSANRHHYEATERKLFAPSVHEFVGWERVNKQFGVCAP